MFIIKEMAMFFIACVFSLPFYLLYQLYPSYLLAFMGGVIATGGCIFVEHMLKKVK